MVDAATFEKLRSRTGDRTSWRIRAGRLALSLARRAAEEESRLALWTPVALGAGAATYLLLKAEPAFWIAPALFVASAGLCRRAAMLRPVFAALTLLCCGFALADIRTAIVAAPALERKIDFASVDGRLIAVDEAPKLRRLIIETRLIEGLAEGGTPHRIRLSWRGKEFQAKPGDLINLRASLSPPPSPAAPDGFDFARQLYFQQIGAVGYAVSAPTVSPEKNRPLLARAGAFVESMRVNLSRRILREVQGDSGAILVALVTGKREAISEEADAAFRDSGLAHMLSISGLHMSIATGLIFFIVRAFFALIEPIALSRPIKKWAAGAALVSGLAYLFVSGNAWPAQRAFIMTAIFFIAIIADRRALSLRNVAVAAVVILVLNPEAVLHPGFQMSFAAVTAIIAFYEWASARADPTRSFSWDARARRYVAGIAVTDVIAASATAPFGLYHFNRAANFGLAANLISIPIMGFWVMPAAILALVLTPFGGDGPAWRLAATGVEIILATANWTKGLPGAVTVFPHWPASALAVITVGGLWLCLMSRPWRLLGLIAIPIAAALIALEPHPQLYVSDEGDNVGVVLATKSGDRRLAVFNSRKSRFDSRVWMEQAGIDVARSLPERLSDHAKCDADGCVAEIKGRLVAISSARSGLPADCARAELVVALYPVDRREKPSCLARLIDRRDVWSNGAHAVNFEGADIATVSAADRRGRRPWTDRRTATRTGSGSPLRRPRSAPASPR